MRATWPFICDRLDDYSGLGANKICDIQNAVYTTLPILKNIYTNEFKRINQ